MQGILILVLLVICYELYRKYVKPLVDANKPPKLLRENKATCNMCGTEWFYQDSDVKKRKRTAGVGVLEALSGHSNAALQAMTVSSQLGDPSRCPECGSRNITVEKVTHVID